MDIRSLFSSTTAIVSNVYLFYFSFASRGFGLERASLGVGSWAPLVSSTKLSLIAVTMWMAKLTFIKYSIKVHQPLYGHFTIIVIIFIVRSRQS